MIIQTKKRDFVNITFFFGIGIIMEEIVMTLAEKIMSLRKKAGWSQEELAEKLGVTRQSVSKWEVASSTPDITKIVQMSKLFGVTTDYLLCDEISEVVGDVLVDNRQESEHKEIVKKTVTLEEATDYIDLMRSISGRFSFAISLFIWSPILLIMLIGFSESNLFHITKRIAFAVGVSALMIILAIAVFEIIMISIRTQSFEYLETEEFALDVGVKEEIKVRQDNYYTKGYCMIGLGIGLFILSVIPIILSSIFDKKILIWLSACLLLFLVGLGVNLWVRSGTIFDSFQRLLQEDDYSPENKEVHHNISWLSQVYWLVITAIYLSFSFLTFKWHISWMIWPIAGIVFSVVYPIVKNVVKRK